MTKEQIDFLNEIKKNDVDPYRTMASNAIIFGEEWVYEVLKKRQDKAYKVISDALKV